MKKILMFFLFLLIPVSSIVTAGEKQTKLKSQTFAGFKFRGIGPALMSGRIADIAIHPQKQSTWYIAVGSGGVWKTENAGTTWEPIFDNEASYSIGCITLDSNNPEIVWVGSGENVSGRHVGYGNGVYKSLNGGKSWENTGLENSEHIAKILVDPRNSNVVYVAAEGPLWAAGGDRGVFKSADGGKNWKQVLKISENTGVTDIEFDPANYDVIYAASYQRRRHVWALLAGGPESGIYKTTDAGANWRKLTNGLPKGDMGKINLAVSPINSDIVYATIEAKREAKGFYRSENAGESWVKRNSYTSGGTGPHYYQEIYASPHKLDRVYQMDVWIQVTEDGGNTFKGLGEPYKHSDNHAMAFDPNDPDYLLVGCDGGLYETWDHGKNWRFVANLPVTQFYKLALDNDYPFYNVVGGTQDNNTQAGPSRTTNIHGIRNSDWFNTVSGDGYSCQVDPEDPNIIYSEWQNGGLMRFDRANGQNIDIKPQPAAGDPPERWNWDAPILISPFSNTRLYFGSQRLWRSDDRGDSWAAISGDLSRGQNRYELKIMGRVWSVDDLYDNGAMSFYGNLTSISESPLQEGLIYVGTDDGLIQVTENGGKNWRKIDTFKGVPEFSFVNKIKASLHDVNTVYAVFDNHKTGDFKPYILKSSNRGKSWTSISGDLPAKYIVWSIIQDHVNPKLLFAATEFGIFFTLDEGNHWIKFTGGVPTIAFRDIEIQRRENDLVGASFGRGFYILDDYSPLRQISEETLNREAALFPVKDALSYIPSIPLGLREKANQGGGLYVAPNPPFGAIFTYYLKESLRSGKELRREKENKIKKSAGDVPFPGYDVLEKENRQEKLKIILIVKDGAGNVVRRISGQITKGFHRIAWDLRYPAFTPTEVNPAPIMSLWNKPPAGPMVTPGVYSVTLAKLIDGNLQTLGEAQTFKVVALKKYSLPNQNREQILSFQKKTGELQRKALIAREVINNAAEKMPFIKKAILDTPDAKPELLKRAIKIENSLRDIRKQLVGNPTPRRLWEPTTPSILSRISNIISGHWNSTYGPTQTHKKDYEIASGEFKEVSSQLRAVVETDLKKLEEDMEAAGAPYTPGRKIYKER